MSFSNQIKSEICELHKASNLCKASTLYGVLTAVRAFEEDNIEIISESDNVLEYISDLFMRLCEYKPEIEDKFIDDLQTKKIYRIKIKDKKAAENILNDFNRGKYAEYINLLSIDSEATWAFVKGTFLICGSVSNPNSDYHLEFSFKSKETALFTETMLKALSLSPKIIDRRGFYVVYFKDSSAIEDILTGMGAVKNVLKFMDSKVIKDLRNRINRRNNCETANLQKTINAAILQVEAIEYIYAKRGKDFLPDDLRDIADFRLENPEMSLNLIAKEFAGRFSKSGVDRRLKKIVSTYYDLKNDVRK